MIFPGRKGKGERIGLVFTLALLLYALYLLIFKHTDVGGFTAALAVLSLCLAFFCYFTQTYELTEDALIIHEKQPLKDKTVPYDQITEYHMVRRRFGQDKPGQARDFYLAYQIGKKRRVAILSPQDGDGFAAEFKKVTGKRWEL